MTAPFGASFGRRMRAAKRTPSRIGITNGSTCNGDVLDAENCQGIRVRPAEFLNGRRPGPIVGGLRRLVCCAVGAAQGVRNKRCGNADNVHRHNLAIKQGTRKRAEPARMLKGFETQSRCPLRTAARLFGSQ